MTKFNIDASLHRLTGSGRQRYVEWIRQYARVDTAFPRCMTYLIRYGQVGDVIEFALKSNGLTIGTIRLKATGKVDATWNHTEAERLINEKILGESVHESVRERKGRQANYH